MCFFVTWQIFKYGAWQNYAVLASASLNSIQFFNGRVATCSTTMSDFGKLWCTNDGIGLLQIPPPRTLVVVGAGVSLCVAVCCTEVVSTSALIAGCQSSFLATKKAVL